MTKATRYQILITKYEALVSELAAAGKTKESAEAAERAAYYTEKLAEEQS